MSEHATSEMVVSLLQGRLSRREAQSVIAHLIHGCEVCARALVPPPVEAEAYDEVIASALATAQAKAREGRDAERWLTFYLTSGRRAFFEYEPAEKRRIASWGLCEVLLRLSHALRKDFPEEMVHFAEMAVEVSGLVSWQPFDLDHLRDLEARAWGELANAYRVADDLLQARSALIRAYELCRLGTHDPLLLARLDDVAASLFAAQRQFKAAYRSLRQARALFLRAGDLHGAGRTLISMGLFFGYDGHPNAAIKLITRGLNEIDRDRDPDLVYHSLHNVVFFTVELGDFEKAREFLNPLRKLSKFRAGELDVLKLCWPEGRIAVGLGDLEAAAHIFAKAKKGYEKAGLLFKAALAGLELAAVWFRQGKTAQVKGIVGELVTAFSRVRVEREAIAALLMLHKALARDRATLELIEQASAALERLAGRPGKPERQRS